MVFENSVPEPLSLLRFYTLKVGYGIPKLPLPMFASDRFKVPPLVARQIPVRLAFSRRRRSACHRQISNGLIVKSLGEISLCQTPTCA
jgi:hypothetical protein